VGFSWAERCLQNAGFQIGFRFQTTGPKQNAIKPDDNVVEVPLARRVALQRLLERIVIICLDRTGDADPANVLNKPGFGLAGRRTELLAEDPDQDVAFVELRIDDSLGPANPVGMSSHPIGSKAIARGLAMVSLTCLNASRAARR
jgi:hypothetical protein